MRRRPKKLPPCKHPLTGPHYVFRGGVTVMEGTVCLNCGKPNPVVK